MSLTPEQKTEIKERWATGASGGEIAKALGLTRNSVIGIITRAGLQRVNNPAAPGSRHPKANKSASGLRAPAVKRAPGQNNGLIFQNRKRGAEAVKPVIVAGNTVFEVEDRPPVVVVPQEAFAPIPDSTPRPWTERGAGCSWPVDVVGATIQHSCCRTKKKDHPNYCPEHHALSVSKANATAPRGSALVRSLRKAAA